MTAKTKKKTLLYTDEITFGVYKGLEDDIKAIVKQLQILADSSLGLNKVDDWQEYLKQPAEYLVQKYWLLWGADFNPPHTDREKLFFNSNAIGIEHLNQLKRNFEQLSDKMHHYKPKVLKNGLKSNLKIEMHNVYLHPDKEAEYNAMQDFLKSAKKLKDDYKAGHSMHLMRFYNGVKMQGLEAVPDYRKFQE